jgi:hypothetical protein
MLQNKITWKIVGLSENKMRKSGILNIEELCHDSETYAEIGWVVAIVGKTRYSYRFIIEKPI